MEEKEKDKGKDKENEKDKEKKQEEEDEDEKGYCTENSYLRLIRTSYAFCFCWEFIVHEPLDYRIAIDH